MKTSATIAAVYGMLVASTIPAFAQTWTLTMAPITNWTSVASSADGSNLVAVVGGEAGIYTISGSIYTSTDSGANWTQQSNAPIMNWKSVASSADGSKIIAAAASESSEFVHNAGIFTSTNYGVTWTTNNLPLISWNGVTSSADGSKLMALGSALATYNSTNFGATWTTNPTINVPALNGGPTMNILAFTGASSADGSKLIAGGGSGAAILSTNFGVTWNTTLAQVEAGAWTSFASSADGTILAAVGLAGGLSVFISTNSATTWSSNVVTPRGMQFVTMSVNGMKLALADFDGGIFSSQDLGNTWLQQTNAPTTNWLSIASSADGNKLFAAVNGGGIYTMQTSPSPALTATPSGTNLLLSWIVPSMTFFVQQNCDLATSNWVTLSNIPAVNFTNLHYQVFLPACTSNGFFRLATP